MLSVDDRNVVAVHDCTWACTVVQQTASIPNGSGRGVLHSGLLVHTFLGISYFWFINYLVREKQKVVA
jgi:hypothetical protein